MQNSIIREKSYKFAIRIVNLYKYLSKDKKDFLSKLTIAYKETRETKYWLNLLTDCQFLSIKESSSLLQDCEEILKIIGSIQSTIKKTVNS